MTGKWMIGAALAAFLTASAAAQIVPGVQPPPAPAAPAAPPPPPPPPASAQQTLDAKFKALMVGRWTITFMQQNMQYTNDIAYRADGTLSGTQTVRQYGEMQYPLQGTWSVRGIDDKTFMLTLSLSGGDGSETLTVIDQNTLLAASVQEKAYRLP